MKTWASNYQMERTRANKQTGTRCRAVVWKVQGTGEEEHLVEDSQPGLSVWDAGCPTCIITYQYEYALLLITKSKCFRYQYYRIAENIGGSRNWQIWRKDNCLPNWMLDVIRELQVLKRQNYIRKNNILLIRQNFVLYSIISNVICDSVTLLGLLCVYMHLC